MSRWDDVNGQSAGNVDDILSTGKGMKKIKLTEEIPEKPTMKRVSYYISTKHDEKIKEMAEKAGINENEFVRWMIDKIYDLVDLEDDKK